MIIGCLTHCALSLATKGVVGVATSCERAHHTFEPIINVLPLNAVSKYSRFNVGTKIAQTGWLEEVAPSLWGKIRGHKAGLVERSWEDAIIEMDDYTKMDTFKEITGRYMEGEVEKVKLCVGRMKSVAEWKARDVKV